VPFGVSHRIRLAEVYARQAPEGIRLAYLLTGERRVQRPRPHALRTVPSVDVGVGHVAIGCVESSIQWPPGPGESHRLTLVHP
jgi:hypothetical protein